MREAVVGVAKIGGNAAARGATRVLDVVPPSTASRCAADTVRGALRVHGRRRRVPGRIVPIGAPFVNVLAHVEEAVPVGRALAHGFGTVPPTAGVHGGQFVAPGVEAFGKAAARGEFPLGFGGQAHRPIPVASEPLAVRRGVEPAHAHHGKRGGAELELSKGGVIRVGHLTTGHAEREHGDAVGGTFVIAPVVLAHEKLAAGDWYQIAWAHRLSKRTAACSRCYPRGPESPAPCRRWKIRGASACPPPCGCSPDKCTHRRARCRWAPGLRQTGRSIPRRGRTWRWK